MTPSSKSDWDKKCEKRTDNIGFLTKTGAFRKPTSYEMAAALAIETAMWQETEKHGWKSNGWKISTEYSQAKGAGLNLRMDTQKQLDAKRELAIEAYIKTPMEIVGKMANARIDTSVYKRGWVSKLIDWFRAKLLKQPQENLSYYERLNEIDRLLFKEKK